MKNIENKPIGKIIDSLLDRELQGLNSPAQTQALAHLKAAQELLSEMPKKPSSVQEEWQQSHKARATISLLMHCLTLSQVQYVLNMVGQMATIDESPLVELEEAA